MDVFLAMIDLRLVDAFWATVKDRDPRILKLNVLVSAPYYKGQQSVLLRLKREGRIGDTFLDNGAYGMNPDGENPGLIDQFEAYKHVVRREGVHFTHVSSMDDRFNEPEHNKLNYDEMRSEFADLIDANGQSVADKLVPTVHSRETAADEVLEYVERGAKLIAVGSKPLLSNEQWQEVEAIRTEMNIRIHRFGNLGFKKLVDWRINSADSAQYAHAGKYGKVFHFWDDELNKPVKIDIRSSGVVTKKHTEFLMKTFGATLSDVLANAELLWVVNIYCSQRMQMYLTDTLGIN